ncbi:MAG: hydantoinase B/oxoprolinase family protein, partial [Acidobacteriota bacterium]|nr:hydantoinase B/oxoprolinase family protein [Acidobacteriota bacterium]
MDGRGRRPERRPAPGRGDRTFARAIGRVAEEMGESLRRAAVSPNIRQRLERRACAVIPMPGAGCWSTHPHIPVHLGSLGLLRPSGDGGRRSPAG